MAPSKQRMRLVACCHLDLHTERYCCRPQHRNKSVGVSIGTANVRATGTDIVHIYSDATSIFGNQSTSFQCIVDSFYRIVLHRDEEATRHLGTRRARIEKSWRGVGEVL